MNAMTLQIQKGRHRFSATVGSFEAASQLYAEKRNASGQGGSKWPTGEIVQDGKMIARVSYNSKIWPAEEWTVDQKPLYVPACCHCGGTPCCCAVETSRPAGRRNITNWALRGDEVGTVETLKAKVREGWKNIGDDALTSAAIKDTADAKSQKGAK